MYRIRPATDGDVEHLPAIERAAGKAFAATEEELGVEEVGDADWFRRAQRQELLFVAVDAGDVPVAFAFFEAFPDSLHLEEVDVQPDHAGHGLGAQLIEAGVPAARKRGLARMTLTTFREVPWNAPYYARLGFRELPREAWSSEIEARVAHEAEHGLDPTRRLVMVRDLQPGAGPSPKSPRARAAGRGT